MAYATTTFYRSTYIGAVCSDDTILGKWLSRASDDIDALVVSEIDTTTLSAAELTALQKACCAQAEYYVRNGDGGRGAFSSVSLGAFSISGAENNGGVVCERAARYLYQADLLYRGVR